MSEARHVAIVPIYPDLLLLTMLGFPRDTKVVRVFIDEDVHGQRMNFVLEHPDLPITQEGALMVRMNPVFDAHGLVAWDACRMPGKAPRPREWPSFLAGLDVSTAHDADVRVLPGDSACEAKDREISPDLKGPRG